MRLRQLFDEVYRPQKLIGRASTTIVQYRHAIATFGDIDISAITDSSLAEFMQRRLDAGIARASVNKERRHLMALCNFAVKRGLIPRKPDVPAVPEYSRVPRAWSIDDITKMMEAVKAERRRVGPLTGREFWRAFILMLYDTGVRKSALLSVKPDECSLDTRVIWIRPQHQKRGDERAIVFSEQTREAMVQIAGPWDWLFPWPCDRYRGGNWKALNERFKRILKRAGLPAKGKYFHRFRASHASYIELTSPGAAQHHLGHSSPAITRRHYLDPLILAESRLVDRLPRP